MPRRRVAVALLVPPPTAGDIDVLRSALGERDTTRVAPHLTLVTPINVAEDRMAAALAVLRAAAVAAGGPLTLRLGPVTSFTPVTPTVHLAVGEAPATPDADGGSAGPEALADMVDAVARPPLWRPPQHPFVAHVTLLEQAPLHRIRAACLALDRVHLDVTFVRLTLLAEQRDRDGVRRWRPLADVDLGGVRTVGRGGLPIELSRGTMLDPEALTALGLADRPGPGSGVSGNGTARVVVARMAEEVVGAAWGPGGGQRRVTGPVDGDLLTAAWHEPDPAQGPRPGSRR